MPNRMVPCPRCRELFPSNLVPRHERICIGDPPTLARLYEVGRVVITETGCYEWGAQRGHHEYGLLSARQRAVLGVGQKAHRAAAKLALGDAFDPELHVLHRCDNPPCINPEHLWQGTQQDNMRDAIEKGRLGANGSDARRKPREVVECPVCSTPFVKVVGVKYPMTCGSGPCGRELIARARRGKPGKKTQVERICPVCQKVDLVQPSYAKAVPCCSPECGHRYAWRGRDREMVERITWNCVVCGAARTTTVKGKRGETCGSRSCAATLQHRRVQMCKSKLQ